MLDQPTGTGVVQIKAITNVKALACVGVWFQQFDLHGIIQVE